jgi:hypothetical protein
VIPRDLLDAHVQALAQGRLTALPALVRDLEHHGCITYFDWPEYAETATALLADTNALSRLTRDNTLKLLSYLAHQDRYAPGVLAKAVKDGTLLALLKRLARFCTS